MSNNQRKGGGNAPKPKGPGGLPGKQPFKDSGKGRDNLPPKKGR